MSDGARGFPSATPPTRLAAANLSRHAAFVTIPSPSKRARWWSRRASTNPSIDILARAHSDAAVEHLAGLGATLVVLGEREIAERMLERAAET